VAGQEVVEAPSVANQTPADVGLYLSTQQAKAFPKLSLLELEELRTPGQHRARFSSSLYQTFRRPDSCIVDTTSYTGPRTVDHLGDFIAKSKRSNQPSAYRC
jgi:protein CMS1